MRKGIFLICILILAASCSQYQKVLKSDDASEKYVMAERLYDEGKAEESKSKLKKSLRLFEQIVPQYRGKPQAERVMYMYADLFYILEDFYTAGYQFERFSEIYPTSTKEEEARFKSARSYYELSPRYSLDQTDTEVAINKLQDYINRYPEGQWLERSNALLKELRIKLDKKAFEIAKQYHHTIDYKAAIKSFDNFILDHPGSPYRERAYFYRFDSAYQLAINSVPSKVQERLETAEEFYHSYKRYYPEGAFVEEADAAYEIIKERKNSDSTL